MMGSMFDNLFDRVFNICSDWEPSKKFPIEDGYHDELEALLRKKLNESRGGFLGGSRRKHKIKPEHRAGICDISIDDVIAIELKRNLKLKKDVDRLKGQVSTCRKLYPKGVIIGLCGDNIESVVDEVRELQTEGGGAFMGGSPGAPVRMVRTDVKLQRGGGGLSGGGGSLFR